MFTYRCTFCGKQHVAENTPEESFQATCIRCGRTFEAIVKHSPDKVNSTGAELPDLSKSESDAAPKKKPSRKPASVAESIDNFDLQEDGLDVPLADDLPEEEAEASESRPKRKKRPKKRRPAEDDDEDLYGMEAEHPLPEDDEPTPADDDISSPLESNGASASAKKWWRRKPVIAGAAAALVLVIGVGGFFAFRGRSTVKKEAPVAKKSKSKSAPKKTTPPPKPAEKPKAPVAEPAIKPKNSEVVRVSAPRLAAEYAADPAGTNRKYRATMLEVTGLFDKMVKVDKPTNTAMPMEGGKLAPESKPADPKKKTSASKKKAGSPPPPPPPLPRGLFLGEGKVITCELPYLGNSNVGHWQFLLHEQLLTVRGVYSADCLLQNCDLVFPPVPTVDQKYKGKVIELTGFVDRITLSDAMYGGFPYMHLEPDTNNVIEVRCFFRKNEEEMLKKVLPGTPVIIQGLCGGRGYDEQARIYHARFDNCRLVETSGPEASTLRVPIGEFLREYEEDLRPVLLPRPAQATDETQLSKTIPELEAEYLKDKASLAKNYNNKLIVVSGVAHSKNPGTRQLGFSTGDTNQVLQVLCRFRKHDFQDLDDGPTYHIRGLCSGLHRDGRTLLLENCEAYDPHADARRLNIAYLPHAPGRRLIYDLVKFPQGHKKTGQVYRLVMLEEPNGAIETHVTHVAAMKGSLFDEAEPGQWIKKKKVSKGTSVLPAVKYRSYGGYVEIGQNVVDQSQNQTVTVWQPVLKLGAKTGTSWQWTYKEEQHHYTLVKFDEYQGRPAVFIREVVSAPGLPHPSTIDHIYVRDVGEVEMRQIQQVTAKESWVVEEKRLIEDSLHPELLARPGLDKPVKNPEQPKRMK